MSEIQKARMQQKRDTNEKWNQASSKNFVPKPGELIIINDNLENQNEGQDIQSVVKVGDGVTTMEKLRGITGEVYVQSSEPEHAGEGAVWIDPEDEIIDRSVAANWDSNEDEPGHVKGRPLWAEPVEITWDGQPTNEKIEIEAENQLITCYLVSTEFPAGEELVGNKVKFILDGQEQTWPIVGYYKTTNELMSGLEALTTDNCFVVADGSFVGLTSGLMGIFSPAGLVLACMIPAGAMENEYSGVYAVLGNGVIEEETKTWYLTELKYNTIKTDKRYDHFFYRGANVYVLDAQVSDASQINYSTYKPGDVILVTLSSEE